MTNHVISNQYVDGYTYKVWVCSNCGKVADVARERKARSQMGDCGKAPKQVFTGIPRKLSDGTWGVEIPSNQVGVEAGDSVEIVTRSGKSWVATVGQMVRGGEFPVYRTTKAADECVKPAPADRPASPKQVAYIKKLAAADESAAATFGLGHMTPDDWAALTSSDASRLIEGLRNN